MSCRSCGGHVINLFSFGGDPPDLVMCKHCSLVQLKEYKNDMENPKELIENLLKTQDEFTLELPYIGSILAKDAFDAISYDQTVYFSLQSLEYLLNLYDLQILDVELNGIYLKVWIKHIDSVVKLREKEKSLKLNNWGTYFLFSLRHRNSKEKN